MRDWPAYDRVLAHRGDITVRLSADAVAGWRAPAGRRTFSGAAIAAALTVRTVYRLALRQAEGRRHSLRRGRRFEGLSNTLEGRDESLGNSRDVSLVVMGESAK